MTTRKRILTGDRPTGRLHLGHYIGSLKARAALQHEYETFLIIADLHMLTTKNTKEDIEQIGENARQMVIDYMACGIDPNLVTIYLQSAVHETYETQHHLPESGHCPPPGAPAQPQGYGPRCRQRGNALRLAWLSDSASRRHPPARANLVPVGKDNLAHVEITREIARRFNRYYGEVFPEPGCPGARDGHAGRDRRPGQDEQESGQRHHAQR